MPVLNVFYNLPENVMSPEPLRQAGPLVNVELSIPAALEEYLGASNEPIPQPIVGRALVDTGASISAVDEKSLDDLGVSPIGEADVHTPAGLSHRPLYPARIAFPGSPIRIEFSRIIGSPLKEQGLLGLIGRDVLRHFVLIYNGTSGTFSLAL